MRKGFHRSPTRALVNAPKIIPGLVCRDACDWFVLAASGIKHSGAI